MNSTQIKPDRLKYLIENSTLTVKTMGKYYLLLLLILLLKNLILIKVRQDLMATYHCQSEDFKLIFINQSNFCLKLIVLLINFSFLK